MSQSTKTGTPKTERSHAKKILIDIVAGTIAGINVTLVGHPFDTLKVRLQTQPTVNPVYNGLVDCFNKTVKWEGYSGLYKGVQFPLIGQMFFRANMFLAFGEAKRVFSRNGERTLKIRDYFKAGAVAWGWGAIAECPIDLFKTQMQIQIIRSKIIPNFKPDFVGFFECFKTIVNRNGILGGYQGFHAHLMRNIPAGAVHLGTFEWLRIIFSQYKGVKVQDLPIIYTVIAGSIGGIFFWLLFFPFDVVKSAIQADDFKKENRKYKGLIHTYQSLYAEGGIPRFFKGLAPCMLRAMPANGILLLTSSYLAEHL